MMRFIFFSLPLFPVVSFQSVLSALLPVLERLLEQTGPDTPSLLQSESRLLQLVLGKFNEASAPLLAEDQNCTDLFIRALRVSSCQIFALEQVGSRILLIFKIVLT